MYLDCYVGDGHVAGWHVECGAGWSRVSDVSSVDLGRFVLPEPHKLSKIQNCPQAVARAGAGTVREPQ